MWVAGAGTCVGEIDAINSRGLRKTKEIVTDTFDLPLVVVGRYIGRPGCNIGLIFALNSGESILQVRIAHVGSSGLGVYKGGENI